MSIEEVANWGAVMVLVCQLGISSHVSIWRCCWVCVLAVCFFGV